MYYCTGLWLHVSFCSGCHVKVTDSAGSLFLTTLFITPKIIDIWAFSVAGPRVWSSLPDHVTAAETLIAFRHRLKTFLFQQSYS